MQQTNFTQTKLAGAFAYLFLQIFFCISLVSAADDPVVIRVGDMQQTRSEFEQRFGMAMVLTAIRAGVPIKSGMQIRDLREHYLEQRVAEMILLQQARLRGLSVTEAELDSELSGVLRDLTEQYGAGRKPGIVDDKRLRNYVREQTLLRKIKPILISEAGLRQLENSNEADDIEALLRKYRLQTEVHIYPDRLE
jgi:hypothetical protein